MKTFLATSIIAMIAAGIYGTVDLARDIKLGTLIQYEKEDSPVKNGNDFPLKIAKNEIVRTLAEAVKKEKTEPLAKKNEVKMEYFSRSAMPFIYDAVEDSLVVAGTDSSQIIAANKFADREVTENKNDSVIEKKEERKFSVKLYSRNRPRRIVEKEVAVAESDSLQKK